MTFGVLWSLHVQYYCAHVDIAKGHELYEQLLQLVYTRLDTLPSSPPIIYSWCYSNYGNLL